MFLSTKDICHRTSENDDQGTRRHNYVIMSKYWREVIPQNYNYILSHWWRHQMEIFSALLAICAGNSLVPGEFTAQRPVTGSYAVFCDLRPNKRLSKQSRGRWFEAPSLPSWRHRNDSSNYMVATTDKGYLMCIYTYKYKFNVWYVFIIACCSLASLLDPFSLVSSISWTRFWTQTGGLSLWMPTLEILYRLF